MQWVITFLEHEFNKNLVIEINKFILNMEKITEDYALDFLPDLLVGAANVMGSQWETGYKRYAEKEKHGECNLLLVGTQVGQAVLGI